jgi:lysophospholipase L1-like esterase
LAICGETEAEAVYLGMRTLLLMALVLSGCAAEDTSSDHTAMTQPTLSFLALGDSYTIGERVDSALRWPVQLAQRLRDGGVPISDPLIIARTGWTTDELEEGIQEAGPEGPYDLVTLLIGVNNQYRGRDIEEYRVQLRGLMTRAVSFAGGRPQSVLVLSIPDWGVMPFAADRDREAIASEIDLFNQVKSQEAAALGLRYIDITAISREAVGDPELVAADGLHPSGVQYSRWVHEVLPVAKDHLAAR